MSSVRSAGRLVAALFLLGFTACVAPRDAYVRAERALRALDLPSALVAFDEVPVSHPRYPEARAAALSVEQRMRRGHELLLEALLRRAEWRDQEALVLLQQARVHWPRMPGVEELIAATSARSRVLVGEAAPIAGRPVEAPEFVPGVPVGESNAPGQAALGVASPDESTAGPDAGPDGESPTEGGSGATPADGNEAVAGTETAAGTASGDGPAASAPTPTPEPDVATAGPDGIGSPSDTGSVDRTASFEGAGTKTPGGSAPIADSGPVPTGVVIGPQLPPAGTVGEDPVAAGLVAVESRLGRGDLEAAVADLIQLAERHPHDARVRIRLAKVLHQRALQRYGQGRLQSAIADWERVVGLDPANEIAQSQLVTARGERRALPPKR